VSDEMKWERYGALGGIVFVIMIVVTIAISGSSPMASDTPAKVLKYFNDNKDAIKVASFVGALAALPIFLMPAAA